MMAPRVLLAGMLMACLVAAVAAGSNDRKRKGECLAAGLVGRPELYNADDAACAGVASKALCLATTGFTRVSNQLRAASCTWREYSSTGFVDLAIFYRTDDGYMGSISEAADFNDFCSLETKISLPRGARGKYYADASISFATTFAGSSDCMAGYRLDASCAAGPMVDPGLALGLPRAYSFVQMFVGMFSIGGGEFERSIYVENEFRTGCGRSGGGRRLADDGSKGWYRYLNTEQATLGLPASGILGSYGGWAQVWSEKGFIYEFIVTKAIGSGAQYEVEVKKGSSPALPVVAYVIDLKAMREYREATCNPTCAAPVHLALSVCYPGKKGKCKGKVAYFPPIANDYGLVVSRLTLDNNPITDGKSINVAYKLDLQVDPGLFTAATATTIGPATAAIKPGDVPASPVIN